MRAAPRVHILATSREALRVGGEHVHRLAPLACPPTIRRSRPRRPSPGRRSSCSWSARRRAERRLQLDDADARIVAGICRKLDGVALAIELAAGSVSAYGLQQTAALLDQQLDLLSWASARRRRARGRCWRHWSGAMDSCRKGNARCCAGSRCSSGTSRWTRRLPSRRARPSTGKPFSAQSRVWSRNPWSQRMSSAATMQLSAPGHDPCLRRGTRQGRPGGARCGPAPRRVLREWLKRTASERQAASEAERLHDLAGLNNVRAALEWCFGADGKIDAGIQLAAAAVPIFLAMSLLTECHHWSLLALHLLPDEARRSTAELRLQAGLGLSLMFTRGEHEAAQAALNRSLAIAEDRGDSLHQLALLGPLHMFHVRVGDFKTALDLARRSTTAARTVGDATGIALGHCILGVSLHAAGRLGEARTELETALQHGRGAARRSMILPSFDHRNLASIVLGEGPVVAGPFDRGAGTGARSR